VIKRKRCATPVPPRFVDVEQSTATVFSPGSASTGRRTATRQHAPDGRAV